jgi:O-antigen/teichoic acid export membrane protein
MDVADPHPGKSSHDAPPARGGGGHSILSHAAVYLMARGVPGVVAFLAIPLFSRLLDPAGYGRYALVVATVGVLNALLFQWLRLSLVRFLPGAGAGADARRLKSTLATVCGVIVLALGAVAAAACLFADSAESRGIIALCWATLAIQATFELCCEYARGSLRPWYYMRLQLARALAFVSLGALFVYAGAGWWGPLAGAATGMLMAVALAWRVDWSDARLLVDRALLGGLVRYGVPLSLTVALTVVIATSDRYLIAWLMGEDAAGLYAVAADFTAQTLTLLMMAIHMASFPVAVRAWESGGAPAVREPMRANAALLVAVGVPSVVGMTVLAPGVARLFFGPGFRDAAAGIIPLVAAGTFVAGLKAYHFDAAFQFAHRTTSQVWIVLVAAVLNVCLIRVAVPNWGINGAAAASVAAYLVAVALTVLVGRRHVALPVPPGACAKVLAAAAVMGLLLYPLRRNVSPAAVVAQIAGGAVAYAAVLLATDFMGLRTHAARRLRRGGRHERIASPVVPAVEVA